MNALYDKGRQKFLEAAIDWLNDTINIMLVDTAVYTVNLSAHDFLDDVPVGARVGTPQTLTGKTTINGVADADDVTFPAVSGASAEALVIYQDTGVEGTSALIAYVDTGGGLPVTPNTGNIVLTFDNGSNKIFKL